MQDNTTPNTGPDPATNSPTHQPANFSPGTKRDKIISIRVNDAEYTRFFDNLERRIAKGHTQNACHLLTQLQDHAKSTILGGLPNIK